MGRERAKRQEAEKPDRSIVGSIVFPGNEYYKEIGWEFWRGENLLTGEPVLNIRTTSGNTFTYPGMNREQARQAIEILRRFVEGDEL